MMQIIRIEKRGVGPFTKRGWHGKFWRKASVVALNWDHKCWINDDGIKGGIMERFGKIPRNSHNRGIDLPYWKSGTLSKTELQAWVKDPHALEKAGFKVFIIEVSEKEVIRGSDSQVIFNSRKAVKKKEFGIVEYLLESML